ncbi:MAG: aminoglycoside phosphotransferase family protein [Chloroflexota bacterium]|nr:aminoglycoside phosphotransferase family protein [Chloroflexota bacterium]MDE2910389.1 aminoglycoside phosphotransferase family protein [Chloroflexota bacterium]
MTSADKPAMARTRGINIEDRAQLLAYLRDRELINDTEQPVAQILRGGVSNRTVWVARADGEDWVIKQALPKLRVQVEWFSDPARIQREACGLRWLGKIIPLHVPELFFDDPGHHILAMTAIPQPHENWKTALLNGRTDRRLAQSFGRLLAKIHCAAVQYPELADEFAERRFFEELRLEPYYGYTATQVTEAAPFLTQLIKDTGARRFALAHGDYSPKNALIYREGLVILDYEVIHFGDPAFDIGFSLTHFLSKAHHLPARRGAFLELARDYWRTYSEDLTAQLRENLRPFAVKHTLACMLARVAGRSPLEYLDASEREGQKRIVLALMNQNINDIPSLIDAFGVELRRAHE